MSTIWQRMREEREEALAECARLRAERDTLAEKLEATKAALTEMAELNYYLAHEPIRENNIYARLIRERDNLVTERDGLQILVMDLAAERDRVNDEQAAVMAERDAAQAELAISRKWSGRWRAAIRYWRESYFEQEGLIELNIIAAELARANRILAHLSPGLLRRAANTLRDACPDWCESGMECLAVALRVEGAVIRCHADAVALEAAAGEMER